MLFMRRLHPFPGEAAFAAGGFGTSVPRLNLLLSYGGWRDDALERQLPPLLRPMGVHCIEARSGSEAQNLIRRERIHVAVVDVSVPMGDDTLGADEAGSRILQLLRRMENPPPTIVVRPPQASRRDSTRGLHAMLAEGAFAVLDRPFPRRVPAGHAAAHPAEALRRHLADRPGDLTSTSVSSHFSDQGDSHEGSTARRQDPGEA